MCTNNLQDMIYSSWDIECNRLKLVFIGHFLPFYPPPKIPKNQNFENMKKKEKCWRYHHFTQVYQKLQSYEVQLLRHGVRQKEFFFFLSFWAIFYHFNLSTTEKIKIKIKNEKGIWRCHYFTRLPKSQSYNVCFVRYGIW